MPDISAVSASFSLVLSFVADMPPFAPSKRVELKRMEHERQRLIQRKMFEEQMRVLEQQQQQELLSLPMESAQSLQHLAASAPTTPPRVNSTLAGGEHSPLTSIPGRYMDPGMLSNAVGCRAHGRAFNEIFVRSPTRNSPSVLSSPRIGH